MKVRVLYVPPAERFLQSGRVYDLADGGHLIALGDAEASPDTPAEADPRPAPDPVEAAVPATEDEAAKVGIVTPAGHRVFGAIARAVFRKLAQA